MKISDKIHVVDNRLQCNKFGLRKVNSVVFTFKRRGGANGLINSELKFHTLYYFDADAEANE